MVYLNAVLKKDLPDSEVGLTHSGFEILTAIYSLPDVERQNALLGKRIFSKEEKYDRYKLSLTIIAVIAVSIVLAITISSLVTDTPISEGSLDIFKLILTNVFEVIKSVLVVTPPTSP